MNVIPATTTHVLKNEVFRHLYYRYSESDPLDPAQVTNFESDGSVIWRSSLFYNKDLDNCDIFIPVGEKFEKAN